MNRRAGLALLVVVLLLAAGVVALVGGSEGDGRPPTTSRPAVAPEGSLRVGVPELAASYNPFDLRSRVPAARQVLAAVLPQLFRVAPDGDVEGVLVDGDLVEVEDSTVRFRLREGARWSDGVAITADDLSFTLEVIRSEVWPGPTAGYERIEEIRGEGARVVVEFSELVPGWERLFSGRDYVLPRHRLEGSDDLVSEWATGPDLSGGPYVFEGSTPGLDVVLSANPEWWGEGPGVADLRLLTVPNATTLQQLFERGELDVVHVPAFTDRVPQMRAIEGSEVAVAPAGGTLVSVYVNTAEVEEAVRVAALDLIDRDRFVRVLFEEEAELATSWGGLEEDPGWPHWLVDRGKADRVSTTTLMLVVAEEEAMGSLLTRAIQRKARGTDLSFDTVRALAERLDGEWLPEGNFDLAVVDEVQWSEPCWRCRWGSGNVGTTNWARTEALEGAAEVDELAGRAEGGDGEAASRLERMFEQQGVVLPMWRPRAVIASRGVEGVLPNAWFPGPLYRVEEWSVTEAEAGSEGDVPDDAAEGGSGEAAVAPFGPVWRGVAAVGQMGAVGGGVDRIAAAARSGGTLVGVAEQADAHG